MTRMGQISTDRDLISENPPHPRHPRSYHGL
jgi:hypothetical protein